MDQHPEDGLAMSLSAPGLKSSWNRLRKVYQRKHENEMVRLIDWGTLCKQTVSLFVMIIYLCEGKSESKKILFIVGTL